MAKRDVIKQTRKEIKLLKEEEKEFDFIKNFSCKTENEFVVFFNTNRESFERLKQIRVKIRELEYSIMTEAEKEEHKQYLINLKKKFSDDK